MLLFLLNAVITFESEMPKNGEPHYLERLSETLMMVGAGTNRGDLRSQFLVGYGLLSKMHKIGDTAQMPEREMIDIFRDGLLQAYIYDNFGFRFDIKPKTYVDIRGHVKKDEMKEGDIRQSAWDSSVLQRINSAFPQISDFNEKIRVLSEIASKIKENEELLRLGFRYQKNKIITEKLEKNAESNNPDQEFKNQKLRAAGVLGQKADQQHAMCYY